ncbi:hypothetical protein KSP39_PZI020839 [Platanthera zijinensis]|uniref:Uncharacterized protein n=1 Tax=Platanthera zijinensis TaxID=2320716 RepID=A0AAP0B046_9ASPA
MKTWITKPMNTALLFWIISVVISGTILFMVMTGMLNGVLPKKSQRDAWFELNNQILNALFTLMCLHQHPNRFLHLALLIRWGARDVLSLRATYCQNGMQKPNDIEGAYLRRRRTSPPPELFRSIRIMRPQFGVRQIEPTDYRCSYLHLYRIRCPVYCLPAQFA